MTIQAGRESRHDAYEGLISPHISLLKRWVSSRAPSELNAEDIVQQTLLLALKNIARLRLDSCIGTWLCKIALNVIRARLRSPEYSRLRFDDPLTIESANVRDTCPSPLAHLEQKETFDRLHRMISMLPEQYRAVVELQDLKEYSTEEVMTALSISRPAVKSRHYRARRMLLKLLSKEEKLIPACCRAAAQS